MLPSFGFNREKGEAVDATAELLTPQEVARRLRVHQDTVHAWMKDGVTVAGRVVKLGATRVGWRWRITEDELRAFLRACNPAEDGEPEQPPGGAGGYPGAAEAAGEGTLVGGRGRQQAFRPQKPADGNASRPADRLHVVLVAVVLGVLV
jgi:excisionase family DNA binding protein